MTAPPPLSIARQNAVEAQEMATSPDCELVATVCQLPPAVEVMMAPTLSTA